MVEDVRLALDGRARSSSTAGMGGNVPTAEEVLEFVRGVLHRHAADPVLEEVGP